MKVVVLLTIIILSVSYSLAQSNPFGMSHMAWYELVSSSQARQHEREVAQREFDARLEFKQRADRVETLYKDIAELFNVLNVEQARQFQLEAEGVKSVKQDVLVSRLSGELKNKVEDLNKINHRK